MPVSLAPILDRARSHWMAVPALLFPHRQRLMALRGRPRLLLLAQQLRLPVHTDGAWGGRLRFRPGCARNTRRNQTRRNRRARNCCCRSRRARAWKKQSRRRIGRCQWIRRSQMHVLHTNSCSIQHCFHIIFSNGSGGGILRIGCRFSSRSWIPGLIPGMRIPGIRGRPASGIGSSRIFGLPVLPRRAGSF